MSNFDLFAEPAPALAPAAVPAPDASLKGKRLYLIDGSGFIFRAFHALPKLTRGDGTPIGAVVGFMNMMIKLMDGHSTDYAAVIFDAGRHTFRNRMYDQYKANRSEPPEELVPQFALVREATRAMNLPALEIVDFEADDLIATYTKQAVAEGMEVVIVSSDKDLMQLIEPGVWLFDAMKNKELHADAVVEKFGVGPEKLGDVLALMGDSSDNIPGVPGIGPKTAAELIMQFGSLEGLLAHLDQVKQPKRRDVLAEHAENARLSRRLVALVEDAPVPVPLAELHIRPADPEMLIGFVREQGFRQLLSKLQDKYGVSGPTPHQPPPLQGGGDRPAASFGATSSSKGGVIYAAMAASSQASPLEGGRLEGGEAPIAIFDRTRYQTITSIDALHTLLQRAKESGRFVFDTETTSLDALRAELVGFSFALAPNEAYYVPLGHKDLLDQLLPGQIPLSGAVALLTPLLADPAVMKIGHNIKYDLLVLAQHGLHTAPVADTIVMSYVLNAGLHPHNMDLLAERYLKHLTISYDEVTGTGRARKNFMHVDLPPATAYAAEDADVTLRLHDFFWPQIIERKLMRVYEMDVAMVSILAAMEQRGITVDRAHLGELTRILAARAAELETEIHALAGHPFMIGSPKQLGEVLFSEQKLPGAKRNAKTGQYTTGADLLEQLSEEGHALPAKVLEWRQATKLMNTYTVSLPEQIDARDGRVHTSFNITGAATGRLSSSEPNLQNIPIRTEIGRRIRDAFVAAPGHRLLSADYSQIELRLLAHEADIVELKDAFRTGRDIHAATASQMFGVPLEEVSGDLRRKAKTINFGIIYGISAHGLATRLQISRQEAAAYIAQYFEQYPGIKAYMERKKEEAREKGYVETIYGRRIHIPGIHQKNPNLRGFAERQAINAPLQGTAADIIKRAMRSLTPLLAEAGNTARMLLQVHDELVFEIKADATDALAPRIKLIMEQAAHLSVPLVVETGTGMHWGEAH